MIDLTLCNEWQRRDPVNGLVQPYYTHPALDEIQTWDLKGKRVFEYGVGASTLWYRSRGAMVYGVESNLEYFNKISVLSKSKVCYETEKGRYVQSIHQWCVHGFDIIIVDGDPIGWRDECIKLAFEHLISAGKLIIDNWIQPSVGWLPSKEVQEGVGFFSRKKYTQANHPDWQTLIIENKPAPGTDN